VGFGNIFCVAHPGTDSPTRTELFQSCLPRRSEILKDLRPPFYSSLNTAPVQAASQIRVTQLATFPNDKVVRASMLRHLLQVEKLPGADSEVSGAAEGENCGYRDFMNSVDVLVMGRNTFEQVLSFGMWPYENKQVVVLSGGSVAIPTNHASTVEVRSCSPRELVKQLSETGAKHLYIDGGNTIQRFLNEGVIHQLIITRIPILIGSGIPLFGPLESDISLEHFETRQYPSGFVQSRYEVRRSQSFEAVH